MTELSVKNIGPVEELEAALPDEGGITVLSGGNDKGKSILLAAVARACGGDGDVTRRDGTLAGELSVFGTTLKVASRCRTLGDIEAYSIEGRYDISELVDPPLKSPAAADARRAKALLQIRGVEADIGLFRDLLDGEREWRSFFSPKTVAQTDLVEMAAAVKADLHESARKFEAIVDQEKGRAEALGEPPADLDLQAEADPDVLQARLEAAIATKAGVDGRVLLAEKARQASYDAHKTLDEHKDQYEGPSVDQAETDVQAANVLLEGAVDRVRKAKDVLAKAEKIGAEHKALYARAVDRRAEAKRHEQTIAAAQESIDKAAGFETPGIKTVARAEADLTEAREAIDIGSRVRLALESGDRAAEHRQKAEGMAKRAVQLRDAAKATDGVLNDAVQSRHLKAIDVDGRTRWVTTDSERGEVFYHDRSRGTRCVIAVDEAIAAMPADGRAIIILRQDLWEGLDYPHRSELDEHCRYRKVNILTAEASSRAGDDQKLQATVWEPTEPVAAPAA